VHLGDEYGPTKMKKRGEPRISDNNLRDRP